MPVDARTTNRNYPKPDPANQISEEFPRLITAFDMIDVDMQAVLNALAQKADADATWEIGDITGLQAALDGKKDASWFPALGELTNVDTTGAADGQFLGRVSGQWIPATIGIANVSGLQTALNGKSDTGHAHDDRYYTQAEVDDLLASAAGTPTGAVQPFAGPEANIPDGWLLCDGAEISRTTYAALFAVIGTTHGAGDGSTTFNLPDLRDRFVVGAGTGSAYTVGDTGGAETVTLTEAQLPAHTHSAGTLATGSAGSHSHTGSTYSAGSHTHSAAAIGSSGSSVLIGSGNYYPHVVFGSTGAAGDHSHSLSINAAGDHTHTISGATGSAGSGSAHENRPPYMALCWIIKT